MTKPPGWYPVTREGEWLRWWDGNAWTEHTRRLNYNSLQQPMNPFVMTAVIVGLLVLSLAVVLGMFLLYIQVASEGG